MNVWMNVHYDVHPNPKNTKAQPFRAADVTVPAFFVFEPKQQRRPM